MICPKCSGEGWLKRNVTVPAFVYGKPTTAIVTKICSTCNGSGKVKDQPAITYWWQKD
jgi:hypothetical protein